MESWRKVWRNGFVPQLSIPALKALDTALEMDDKRLIQGATCEPLPMPYTMDYPVEGVCLLGFCGLKEHRETTVADVDEYFVRVSFECDSYLGEPAACRWLINWWDETRRKDAIAAILPEVKLALERKEILNGKS
jgi:hypothetical protein